MHVASAILGSVAAPESFEITGLNGVRLTGQAVSSSSGGYEGDPYELALHFVDGSALVKVHLSPSDFPRHFAQVEDLNGKHNEPIRYDSGFEAGGRLTMQSTINLLGIIECTIGLECVPRSTVHQHEGIPWRAEAMMELGAGADIRSQMQQF